MSDRKHSKRRRSRKLSNNKFVRFLQENVKNLVGAAVLLVILILLIVAIFAEGGADQMLCHTGGRYGV